MPILGWSFDFIANWPHLAIALTVIMLVGAVFYARAIMLRYASGCWREIPDHERLLDAATLGLLVLQITYFQFFDRYLLPLLPFVLIVVARRAGNLLDRLARHTLALALAAMVGMAVFVRGVLSNNEAVWAGGDSLLARGVPAEQISTTWAWACYHGAFDDFIDAYGGHPPGDDPRYRFMADWLPRMGKSALYAVEWTEQKGDHLRLISTIPYRDVLLRERAIYVYQRIP